MGLDEWRAWQRIFRDFVIVGIGAFMLIYETIAAKNPNFYLIGAGLAALGLPPTIRIDEVRRRKILEDDTLDEDRWSHLR